MMRSVLVAVAIVVGIGLLLFAVGMALASTGFVPVAASAHHMGPIEEVLEMAFDSAVDRGSKDLRPPADVDSPEMQRIGLLHYQDMCVTCHGAPGVERSEVGKGLYPEPPLLERKKHARVAATFWVVKNGVRDTGMPAFGPTHTDRELWAMAGFAVAMAHMTPEEYARRLSSLEVTASAGTAHDADKAIGVPSAAEIQGEVEAKERAMRQRMEKDLATLQGQLGEARGEPSPAPAHAPHAHAHPTATPHGSG